MVLVDTSVWIKHLRQGEARLSSRLEDGEVICHPFIIGELACGTMKQRGRILSLLQALPAASVVEHDELMHCIESHRTMGKGLGYVDMHLLASAMLSSVSFWTFDKSLQSAATKLGVAFSPR